VAQDRMDVLQIGGISSRGELFHILVSFMHSAILESNKHMEYLGLAS